MTESAAFLVFLGGLAGGLVNGLTGFGTGMTALPIWLQVLAPTLASPLTAACSVAGQLQTLPSIWHAMEPRRVAPFIAGGVLGVPVGVWILPHIDARIFKAMVGVLLVLACAALLLKRRRLPWAAGGCAADAAIGFAGGVLGGLAGLSGLLPTLWAELRGWEKDARRAVFQGYNLSILVFALVTQGAAGLIDSRMGLLLMLALPGTVAGAFIGRRIYARLDTERFSRVVLGILLAGGIAIVAASLR